MSRPRRPLRRSMPSSQRKKAEVLLRLAACNVAPGLGKSWKQQLYGEFEKPYFVELLGCVALEGKHHMVYPPPEQVFTWTQMGDIRDVGQEPYHEPNQAHRLCFSVQKAVPPPPVWKTFLKSCLQTLMFLFTLAKKNLSGWARQGVLLLTAILTFRAHQVNSHKERGWEQFTDAVVYWLNEKLLWSAHAQKGSATTGSITMSCKQFIPPRCR